MQTTANITRFITGNSSRSGFADLKSLISSKEIFQRIVIAEFAHAENSKQVFTSLTNKLISLAENAYATRNLDTLEEASSILTNLPLNEARQIGIYYQSIAKYRKGERSVAQEQIEALANNMPLFYRARAIQTLGSFHHEKGNIDEALRLHLEALCLASGDFGNNLLATVMAELRISYILSDLGDHQRALSKIEGLSFLVRHLAKQNPFYFYVYHNALAVEFAEAGRFDEAEAASRIALASPFASAYPEWAETREEIAQKRDSRRSNLPALPEPSLAAESNSVLNQDSHTAADADIEAEARPQAEQARATKRLRALPTHFLIRKYNYQISSESIPAKASAVNWGSAQSILERLGSSIRPRSPPSLF